MQYEISGFQFLPGECTLDSVDSESIRTPSGDTYLIRETHNCSGEILPPSTALTVGDKQRSIADRIAQIKGGLRSGRDAGLLSDDGQISANYLREIDSVNGIQVSPISFGRRDQADGVSGRTFSFSVFSEMVPADGTSQFDFRQTITYDGDTGPEFVGVELDSGPPDLQQVREQTLQTITQTGSAVSLYAYPLFPPAMYSSLPFASKPVKTKEEPRKRGGTELLYPISWRYVMMSTTDQLNQLL